jgi:hypothetical protein
MLSCEQTVTSGHSAFFARNAIFEFSIRETGRPLRDVSCFCKVRKLQVRRLIGSTPGSK